MKIKDLLKSQFQEVNVDGVKLQFKKLSWKEMVEFEKMSSTLSGSEDEQVDTLKFVSHLFENFIQDDEGNKAIEESEIQDLPFSFCVNIINKFVEVSRGGIPTEEEAKKK
jgi:hypothetical protein